MNDTYRILDVTPENVAELGVCCIKNKRAPGFKAKVDWFRKSANEGIRIKLAVDKEGKQIGFLEYLPAEISWRPVKAPNYLFIQCIAVYAMNARRQGLASSLVKSVIQDAMDLKKDGICVMTSEGAWMANKSLFEKNSFLIADRLGRFELMFRKFNEKAVLPLFIDWTQRLQDYKSWNLFYSDQCPWHNKSVEDLGKTAAKLGIELNIIKLEDPQQAQNAPTGFGTFALVKDGKLLADHYLSKTRFESIVSKELT